MGDELGRWDVPYYEESEKDGGCWRKKVDVGQGLRSWRLDQTTGGVRPHAAAGEGGADPMTKWEESLV